MVTFVNYAETKSLFIIISPRETDKGENGPIKMMRLFLRNCRFGIQPFSLHMDTPTRNVLKISESNRIEMSDQTQFII